MCFSVGSIQRRVCQDHVHLREKKPSLTYKYVFSMSLHMERFQFDFVKVLKITWLKSGLRFGIKA